MEVKLSHRLHHLPLSQFLLYNSRICKSRKRTSFPEPPRSLPEVKNDALPKFRLRGKSHGLGYKLDSWFKLRQVVTTPTCVLLHAKTTTGYFLVLGPLIAFCIGCVISLVRGKAARDSVREDFSKPKWKHALRDIREPDSLVSELADLNVEQIVSADHDQYPSADAYEEHSKLERDYQIFLSECGVR